jgi:hypothetical protein
LRKTGVWSGGKTAGAEHALQPDEPLRRDLYWIADAFLDLSNKRNWIAGGFSLFADVLRTNDIRAYFHEELRLSGAARYAFFRRMIDALDADWRDDFQQRQEAARKRREAEDARKRGR